MKNIFILIAILTGTNWAFDANVIAQEKGGEVGNPIGVPGSTDLTGCSWEINGFSVEVKAKEVIVNGEKYPIGKEVIADAYGVSSAGWAGDSTNLCKAQTHGAFINEKGEIVLIKTYRAKPSKSAGILCTFSKDIKSYSDAYTFEQSVLTPSKNGDLAFKKIFITSTIGNAVKINSDELKNANLEEENKSVKAHIEWTSDFNKTSFNKRHPAKYFSMLKPKNECVANKLMALNKKDNPLESKSNVKIDDSKRESKPRVPASNGQESNLDKKATQR